MPETFSDIFTLFSYLGIPMLNGQIPHRPAHYEVMELSPNDVRAVPMPTFPLFRGQNRMKRVLKEKCKWLTLGMS